MKLMFCTDDPVSDFHAHDRQQTKRLAQLPVCSICGEPIQDEHLYLINDEFVCPACLDRDFKKDVDDYVE